MPEAFLDAMTRAHKFFSQSSDDEIYQARCNSRNSAYFWDKPAGEYLDAAYAAKEIIRREK